MEEELHLRHEKICSVNHRKVKEDFISEHKRLVRHTAVSHVFVYIDPIA